MTLAFPKPLPAAPKKKGGPRTERGQAKDAAMDAWKAEIKARAGSVCEMAGIYHTCRSPLDAHHVMGKGAHPRLALDLENGVALCRCAHDLVHRSRWFKPHFWAFFDGKYPGRREQLQQKVIKEARLS